MKIPTNLFGAILFLSFSSSALFADNSVDPQQAASSRAAVAEEEPDLVYFRSGPHISKYVISSTKPDTYNNTNFTKLKNARVRVRLPIGSAFLINASFAAETRCSQPGSTRLNWCEASIRVNGLEAEPAASSNPPDSFAMDSTDGGEEGTGSWEAHAFDRHACVQGSTSSTTRFALIDVYVKVQNQNVNETPPAFWVDDWSLVVETARGCVRREYQIGN